MNVAEADRTLEQQARLLDFSLDVFMGKWWRRARC